MAAWAARGRPVPALTNSALPYSIARAGIREGKGGADVAKNAAKNPYDWDRYVRPWLGKERGMLAPKQHGHHWAIPQNGWGKNVPDWIKNQPWNIKPMPSAEVHGRLTNSYKGKPQFNAVERYMYGTPTWSKVGTGAAVGHPAAAGKAQADKRR